MTNIGYCTIAMLLVKQRSMRSYILALACISLHQAHISPRVGGSMSAALKMKSLNVFILWDRCILPSCHSLTLRMQLKSKAKNQGDLIDVG